MIRSSLRSERFHCCIQRNSRIMNNIIEINRRNLRIIRIICHRMALIRLILRACFIQEILTISKTHLDSHLFSRTECSLNISVFIIERSLNLRILIWCELYLLDLRWTCNDRTIITVCSLDCSVYLINNLISILIVSRRIKISVVVELFC